MVMSVLSEFSSAFCHEDIEKKLSGKMDRVTIYRILQCFCDEGKIHKIAGRNGKIYYALCHHCSIEKHNDNHLHFHCVGCDTVSCLDETVTVSSLTLGYEMLAVFCILSGYCPKCLSMQNEKVEI